MAVFLQKIAEQMIMLLPDSRSANLSRELIIDRMLQHKATIETVSILVLWKRVAIRYNATTQRTAFPIFTHRSDS